MKKNQSRREFIKTLATAAAGLMIVPRHVLGGKGFIAPSDKVNVAAIGIGGQGAHNMRSIGAVANANVTALCDVDWDYGKKTFDRFPNAKQYRDYREMFDKSGKDFDAVVIATPDNTHAVLAMHAMARGKHVYCQKPLT